MSDLVLLYSCITVIVFLLSVLSVDWQGTNPRVSGIIALTSWAWPLWLVIGFLLILLIMFGFAMGWHKDTPAHREEMPNGVR